MIGIRQPYEKPEKIIIKRVKWRQWTQSEDALLLDNIHNRDLTMPNRTLSAIKSRRSLLYGKHGIIPKPRIY